MKNSDVHAFRLAERDVTKVIAIGCLSFLLGIPGGGVAAFLFLYLVLHWHGVLALTAAVLFMLFLDAVVGYALAYLAFTPRLRCKDLFVFSRELGFSLLVAAVASVCFSAEPWATYVGSIGLNESSARLVGHGVVFSFLFFAAAVILVGWTIIQFKVEHKG